MTFHQLANEIQQFLSHQIEHNQELSDAAKESLQVAVECIVQAYELERRPASNQLLDLYRTHRQNQQSQQHQSSQTGPTDQSRLAGDSSAANPMQFIQSLATTILSQATAGVAASTAAPHTAQSAAGSEQSAPPPRQRKRASEAEKLAAESFKNQGNDLLKQDKYREAFECYTQAISIDENNAIYYSNRAAASSKLGDHQAALRDCQEAIEIDPNYSKAYGRMGLAYASMENHQKAKEAYVRAVELDPHNESYRNNLKIAEEKLAEAAAGGANAATGGLGGMDMGAMLRSVMSNPEIMNLAMRSIQDPRMQNLFGFGGQSQQTGQQPSSEQPTTQQQSTTTNQQSTPNAQPNPTQTPQSTPTEGDQQQQQQPNMGDFFNNLTSRLGAPGATGSIDLMGAGQRILSTIEQNPELVNNMRRMMSQFMPPPNQPNNNSNNNDSDRDPPPGYS